MKIKVHPTPIIVKIGDKEFKLEDFEANITSSNPIKSIVAPFQKLMQDVTDELRSIETHLITEKVTQTVMVDLKRAQFGQWRGSIKEDLQEVIGKNTKVRFKSGLHNAMAKIAHNKFISTRALDNLIALGLAKIENDYRPALTPKGNEYLNTLRERTVERDIQIAAIITQDISKLVPYTQMYLIDYGIYNCFLEKGDNSFSTSHMACVFTEQTRELLKKHAPDVISHYGDTVMICYLIGFLQMDTLPEYLSHEVSAIRNAANRRVKQLQNEINSASQH